MEKIINKIRSNWEALIMWFFPTPEIGQVIVDLVLGIVLPIILIWGIKRYGPRICRYLKSRKTQAARRIFIATKNKKKAAEFRQAQEDLNRLGGREFVRSVLEGHSPRVELAREVFEENMSTLVGIKYHLQEIQEALDAGSCVAASDGSPESCRVIEKGVQALEYVKGTLEDVLK